LLRKIAKFGFSEGGHDIIEIGPGPCGLTRAILENFPKDTQVFCIEKDKNLKIVHDNLHDNRVHFIYEDALKLRISSITDKKCIIISNLPYNVGTQLLINWLEYDLPQIHLMVLTFQEEVANRIVSKAGKKEYGRLSIICQLLCKCEKLFNISNGAFCPPPNVTSSVIRLTPFDKNIPNIKKVEKLTAVCFQKRRKTIFSILKGLINQEQLAISLENCAIDKMARPETISPEKFLYLADTLDL
jgi:16S rRNA (adenine1518-N6/adenine1519-N6)-dimethyltransferase